MENNIDDKKFQELLDGELEQVTGGMSREELIERRRFISKFLTARLNQANVIHGIRDLVVSDVLKYGVDAAVKRLEEIIKKGDDTDGFCKRALEVLQKNMTIIKAVWY